MSNGFFSSRGGAVTRVVALALALAILPACGGSSVARPSATQARATQARAATPAATATPANPTVRQVFEQGVAYPRWGTQSYGVNDSGWPAGVQSMRDQTNARWVEMIVSLDQSGYSATNVYPGSDTLSPDALYVGVLAARQAGVNVFIEPLLNVHNEPDNWSGHVTFATEAQAQLWFRSYWAAYEPYVKAAKAAGASQVSIGAEYDILQAQYPDQWTWLAHQVKAAFGGPVTYDANHSILGQTAPSWMKDRDLSAIGVSMYLSLLRRAPGVDGGADRGALEIERAAAARRAERAGRQAGDPDGDWLPQRDRRALRSVDVAYERARRPGPARRGLHGGAGDDRE